MRIAVADYSGHAFPVSLSRELARRGHKVLHLHFVEFQSPKGRLEAMSDDPVTFAIEPISLGQPFAKHEFIRRRKQEIEIGRRFAARVKTFNADVVVGCNMPLDTIRELQRESVSRGRKFIFWQQDIYSIAIERILSRRLGLIGRLVGRYYRGIERQVLRASNAVVVISDDFTSYLKRDFDVDIDRVHVVENWASLEDISPRPKDNPWSRAMGLSNKDVVLYTGTLGMKHDPKLIVAVAEDLRTRPNTEIVVISEGPVAEYLREAATLRKLSNLKILGFQPFEDYCNVLASADVLLAILEKESGAFCVPSKILSYMCAGRPIAMSGPLDNLSARILRESGGGVIVDSGNVMGFLAAVRGFLDDSRSGIEVGYAGRAYAEASFNVAGKADRFEQIFDVSKQ